MPYLTAPLLDLARCPHCNIDQPNLSHNSQHVLKDSNGTVRFWRTYACARCAGLVTATAEGWDHEITEMYPDAIDVSDEIPERARIYLAQAINSKNAPAGAVMLAASSIDSMLKNKGLNNGSLYVRIDKAVEQNLITPDMARWAHEVRLDANDQRHADEEAGLPMPSDAQKCIDFAMALGHFLFVLPARIQRGIANARDA